LLQELSVRVFINTDSFILWKTIDRKEYVHDNVFSRIRCQAMTRVRIILP